MRSGGFLAGNISIFTKALLSILSAEELCRRKGLLQHIDPRLKALSIFIFILTAGLLQQFWSLALLGALIFLLSILSRIPVPFFLKRIFLFIPIFTVVIALPALFITPGVPLVHIGAKMVITQQGARTAGLLVLRVTDSLSLGVLLIITTAWNDLLAALRWFRIPAVFIDILGMTFRYVFLLLNSTNSLLLARKSRTLGSFSGRENRRWLARSLTANLIKSHHMSEAVYLSMLSRGYQGEAKTLYRFSLKKTDILWLVFILLITAALLYGNYR